MHKLKTIFKYLKNMDYKNMWRIINKVSKKSRKLKIVIFFDMLYCGFAYGAGYYDYQEFEFYLLNGKERKTYLTRVKNNLIVKNYNDKAFFYKFDDKSVFNELFKDFLQRDYLVINSGNYQEFIAFTKKHKELIVKPVAGEGGHGVEKVIIKKGDDLKMLFNKLLSNEQCLIEECIKQHHAINDLYASAVNTLRLFTFYDGKEGHLLNSVFKIGNGGVTDNFSSGSMYTFVSDDGTVLIPAIDQNDEIYQIHPLTKKAITGFAVPLYQEACELVKKAAKIVPEVKYVGWDVAISENGPVLVEGNSFPGVYQIKPSLGSEKIGLIPKYQKVMKIK